jgi:hypothetical protein
MLFVDRRVRGGVLRGGVLRGEALRGRTLRGVVLRGGDEVVGVRRQRG